MSEPIIVIERESLGPVKLTYDGRQLGPDELGAELSCKVLINGPAGAQVRPQVKTAKIQTVVIDVYEQDVNPGWTALPLALESMALYLRSHQDKAHLLLGVEVQFEADSSYGPKWEVGLAYREDGGDE
jgi:hypothetical protein